MSKSPQAKGGLVPPPPSNGGILRKDSSFSKAKLNAARNQAPPAGQPASNMGAKGPAGTPSKANNAAAAQPGMRGPNNQPQGGAAKPQQQPQPGANTRAPAASPGSQNAAGKANPAGNQGKAGAAGMNPYGGQMGGMNPYGSQMGGMGGMGGMNPYGSQMGGMNPYGSQMGGMGGMGGMNPYGSQMGGMNPYGSQMGGMNPYGSMYGNQMGNAGSMYGFSNPGSMMNMGSMYSNGGMGSLYGLGGMGSMYQPVGSLYGTMGGGQTSAYNFAAQWGSLANMSQAANNNNSAFGKNSKITTEDLCPNIGTYDDGKPVKRSGRRGGNKLYSKDKKDAASVVIPNSQAAAMTIKKKNSFGPSTSAAARSAPTASSGDKPRAKIPANFDVHSLIVVGQDKGKSVTVKDPNTVVFESNGKKETFECEEALEQNSPSEEVESVLLSGLRGNWFGGHNSALMIAAGSGKVEASYNVARGFIEKCVERLEGNLSEASTKFDITTTMCSIKNADTGKDLLGSGDYKKLEMGSSPIYGPCLMGLTSKTTKTAKETLNVFNQGLSASNEKKDIICAFLVLKQIKKGSAATEVYLSSLCIALFREEIANLVSIKEKSSSSPHKLFRYAFGGPCVCVSVLCISNNDDKARNGLEAERKVREVKNRPPRSGNVKKFIDYTEKELSRQKEKMSSASESEKKALEKRITSMTNMIKDAQEMQDNPEKTTPKGYTM